MGGLGSIDGQAADDGQDQIHPQIGKRPRPSREAVQVMEAIHQLHEPRRNGVTRQSSSGSRQASHCRRFRVADFRIWRVIQASIKQDWPEDDEKVSGPRAVMAS